MAGCLPPGTGPEVPWPGGADHPVRVEGPGDRDGGLGSGPAGRYQRRRLVVEARRQEMWVQARGRDGGGAFHHGVHRDGVGLVRRAQGPVLPNRVSGRGFHLMNLQEVLHAEKLFPDAISRAYYAVMHAAKVALLTRDVVAESHGAVRRQFGSALV